MTQKIPYISIVYSRYFLSLAFLLISIMSIGQDSTATVRKAPWFVERFKVSAGFFIPINNTNIKVGINSGPATELDFENDLGFDRNINTVIGNIQWRTTRRSRLSLSYYQIDRSSTTTIDEEITFQDQTYPINASVNAFFNTSIYQFSYGYAILAKPRYEAGVLIGTHIVGADVGMSLNTTGGNISGSSDFGFTAPLPDLGIWGGYAFSDRLAFNLETSYLAITVNHVTGSILTYNMAVTYKVYKGLDASIGYTGLNFKLDVIREKADGHFNWSYNGPSFFLTYSFGKKYWVH